jgi:hypothetical protein
MADKDKRLPTDKMRIIEDAVPATRPLIDLAERASKRVKKARTAKGRDRSRR